MYLQILNFVIQFKQLYIQEWRGYEMKKILLIIIAVVICGGGITAVIINNNNKNNEPVASSNISNNEINIDSNTKTNQEKNKYTTAEELIYASVEYRNTKNYDELKKLYNFELGLANSLSESCKIDIDYAYEIVKDLDKGADYINENYPDFVDKYLNRLNNLIGKQTTKSTEKLSNSDEIFSEISKRKEKQQEMYEYMANEDIAKAEIKNIKYDGTNNYASNYEVETIVTNKNGVENKLYVNYTIITWNNEVYLIQ